MPPKAQPKTKADDLHRIRQNQQRSRDRRKAYVAELEAKVARLEERLDRLEPQREGRSDARDDEGGVVRENEARKEMLKALGIEARAQEQFVRAFVKTKADSSGPSISSRSPSSTESSKPALDDAAVQPRSGCSKGCRVSETDHGVSSVLHPVAPDQGATQAAERFASSGPQALVPYTTCSLDVQNLGAGASAQLEQQTMWTPCLWNGSMQSSSSCSESTTGCSIAFSMLLSNNSRGYTLSDIDERLQAAYRQDSSVAEGCSVLNKVLFQLLSDIS